MTSLTGKRSISTHNVHIRLANMRHAMLDQLRKPLAGFERVTRAHFFFKRDELKELTRAWARDAQELAIYDAYMCRRAELACAGYNGAAQVAKAERQAALDAAAVKAAGTADAKKAADEAATYRASKSFVSPPAGLASSISAIQVLVQQMTTWCTDTLIQNHRVFIKSPWISASHAAAVQAAIDEALAKSDAAQLARACIYPTMAPAHAAAFAAAVEAAAKLPYSSTASPELTFRCATLPDKKARSPTAFDIAACSLEAAELIADELDGLTRASFAEAP